MGTSLFDQPGAITSLLQSMTTPPITPSTPSLLSQIPGPTAPPIQPMSQPAAPKPRMLQRIHDYIVEHSGGQTSAGVDELVKAGLLSQDEVKRAQPGLLSLIAGTAANTPGGGQAAYQNNLNNILTMHGLASQYAEQKRLASVRERMATLFAPKPGESQDDIRDRNEKMFAYAIQNRDPETAKLLETANVEAMRRTRSMPVLHEVEGKGWFDMTDPANPKPVVMSDPTQKNKQIVNAQEGVFRLEADGLYDVATGKKYAGRTVHPVALAPSYTPITVGGGEGQPALIKPFDTKTGTAGATIGEAKPTTTRIESAINTAAKARLTAAVSEMNNAHAGMSEFEQKLKDGKISINGLSQFAGATANSFTHDDPASRLVQSAALSALNRVNPELARYIRRGLSFAEGESMVSQRPSDFRTKMAAFLSTAASGASPDMIADIESRRTSILNPLNDAVKPATSAPAAVSPLRAKYDAAAAHLKAQGKTAAQIKATIGDPP